MEVKEELLCRLCFKICTSNFEIIEDTVQGILNFLLLNLDLGISNEPVVCNNCTDNLKKCVRFKETCLQKDGTSMPITEEDVKVNMSTIISGSADVANTTSTFNSGNMCYFCMNVIDQDSLTPLKNGEVHMTVVLEEYFPELALNIPENSAVCMPCYKSLLHHISFMRNCLNIEENIRDYCRIEGTNGKGQVNLSSVLHFTTKNILQTQHNLTACSGEKPSEQMYNEDAEVNLRNENFVNVDKLDLDFECEDNYIKREQDDWDRFQDHPQELNSRFLITDTEASKTKRYKCQTCPYQSNRKSSLQQHIVIHKNALEVIVYKCTTCLYQSNVKSNVSRHVLTHKGSLEATAYKCERCTYQTKYKHDLQKHGLTHMSSVEVQMYTCKLCLFQTKYKNYLQRHMLIHKNTTDVTVYRCELCPFQSRYKRNLLPHVLRHKSSLEMTMYECDICKFKTKLKRYLTNHMEIHKTTSELMYKCAECPYQTRRKGNLSIHVLIHRNPSEVTMYKCELCTFQTMYRSNLSKHMLTHKST